ncbi:MAG: TonB-dependent receptor domain-containing protein, partial [bacterium]
ARLNGSPFIVDAGDTLSVFRRENAGKAFTTGFAIDIEVSVAANLALMTNLSYTYGQNTSDDKPLTGVPPFAGLIGIRWRKHHSWAEFNARFAAEQSRLALEDKEDLRIPEGGTPGWYTLNFRFGADLSPALDFRISIDNILDRNYREHLSGFNAPGRNFVFSVRLKQ